jgi:hypothetical protein
LDIVAQATKIIDEAQKNNVILRALGGMAIAMHCPSAKDRLLGRVYVDIDLVGHEKQSSAIKKLLIEMGFEPNKRFNALHGSKRLQFWDTKRKIDIDIFLDVFEMCHKINLKDRLDLDQHTIPLADLLITKLQVVELNEKDVRDIIAMLRDHEIDEGEPDKIDVDYIAKLCSGDWGLYKTLTMNAQKTASLLDDYALQEADKRKVKSRIAAFLKRLEEQPKSMKWKIRAKLGDRTKWYETVEEVKR